MKGHVYIGTSGFSYPEWKNRFYPKSLKDRDRLSFYAERFNTVEINNSFYRMPDAKYVARWDEAVPDNFKFCFKLWRGITHVKRFHDCLGDIDEFLQAVHPAHKKSGPLLVQLPPGMKRNALEDLAAVLRHLCKKETAAAVECRDMSWYNDETYAMLRENGAGLVLHDMPGSSSFGIDLEQPFYYIRHHGAGRKYAGSYAPQHLDILAKRIGAWGRESYVFFNNTIGAALENATDLARLINGTTS